MLFVKLVHNFQLIIGSVCYFEYFHIIITEIALVNIHCINLCTISHTISTSNNTLYHTDLVALFIGSLTLPLLVAIILIPPPVVTIGYVTVFPFTKVWLVSTEVALAIIVSVIAVE